MTQTNGQPEAAPPPPPAPAPKPPRPAQTPAERRLSFMPLPLLQSAKRNPKDHDLEAVEASIARFGYVSPLELDERTGRLVGGHGRLEVLRKMHAAGKTPPKGVSVNDGQWLVPVVRGWSSKTDAEAEAYLLASNRTTELGGWDDNELADMLSELSKADGLAGSGFSAEDLTALLGKLNHLKQGHTDPDEVPEEPKEVWVRSGELFALGDHRLLCGDSVIGPDVDLVMGEDLADICWTDPPYNVDLEASAAGYNAKRKTRPSKSIANDNMGDNFPEFCSRFLSSISRALRPGGMIYLAMSAKEWPTVHAGLVAAGFHWSSSIIWLKDSLVLSRKDYHSRYEPIWYGWKDDGPRLVGLEDRTQDDVWEIPRPKRSDEHPTMKPVELVVRAIQNSSKPGALVFEPFSGSGSTIIACETSGRRCRAIELEPRYVQVAIERWEKFTGNKAEKLNQAPAPAPTPVHSVPHDQRDGIEAALPPEDFA